MLQSTLMSAFPIVLLIWMMTKRHALPSHIALPVTALLVGLIQLFYFHSDGRLLSANLISGILSVLTPISIVAGAILLNRVLVISGAEAVIGRWLDSISNNKIAQLMIIGWAFAFMLEGASGFGTPAAIAAPMLVELGFRPIKVAIFALIMNSVPVSFGAVGTPLWFGFEALELSPAELLEVASQTALINALAAFLIPLFALKFVVSWSLIRLNLMFILLSIVSCTAPYFVLAHWNYEFPALVGGAIGLIVSILLAKANVGLSLSENRHEQPDSVPSREVVFALLPLVLLIVVLIMTRISALGVKGLLTNAHPWFGIDIGSSHLTVSHSLIVSIENILSTPVAWSYKTLYVPALIPFLLVVLVSIPLLRLSKDQLKEAVFDTGQRIKLPFISLAAALVMVNFMMQGEQQSPIFLIANGFATLTGEYWSMFAALLGALGSFFSGSATVSNLTFGGIQQTIAVQVGLPVNLILALQAVGAAMGNMVCINNIIAVSTILGIANKEGFILKKTIVPMLAYAAVAASVAEVLILL